VLSDSIIDVAVATAKRQSLPEVNRVHVLAALLECNGVKWPDGQRPDVDLTFAFGPPGSAISAPNVSDEIQALVGSCSSPEAAQRLAYELIEQLRLLSSEPAVVAGEQPATAAELADTVAPQATAPVTEFDLLGAVQRTDPPTEPRETSGPTVSQSGAASATPDPSIADQLETRAAVLSELEEMLGRANPRPILLHGRPGAGRTTVLQLLAERLKQADTDRLVRLVPARELLVNPDAAMSLSKSNIRGSVYLLDDVDLLFGPTAFSAVTAALSALLAPEGPAVVLSMPSALRGRFEITLGRLAARCTEVAVDPLVGADLDSALASSAQRLAEFHRVSYLPAALAAAAAPPGANETRVQPGLGLDRLDVAGAAVARLSRDTVSDADVVLGASAAIAHGPSDGLRARLDSTVLGQAHAVERLVRRLRLTQAGFDLRPERPDGVFLFVGPTGVGKTALARSLAVELFGAESNLIRLDMSEYSDPWAISRLTGPQPGYVGSTEPESWLTTRVRKNPRSVVLLDEIEKAHPDVWNLFLQVFDAGRLTDSRGEVADFSSAVVIMTSNLGTGVTERAAIGFHADRDKSSDHERRVMEVVADAMRPELLNRIDSSIVFHSLDKQTVTDIARAEVAKLASTLGPRGYLLHVDDKAVRMLADDGYDEKFGARHVQRAIERNLLEPLVELGPGAWKTCVVDGRLTWERAL